MASSTSPMKFRANPAAASFAGGYVVAGDVRLLRRLEGFAVFAAALVSYALARSSWPVFVLFFLAPDLAMLAYLGGPRVGAMGYNLAHTYALPLALAIFGFVGGAPGALASGLIWIAHIGFDRMLGFGLKYPTGFGDTHLGPLHRL